jgi:Tol biopolymer transport system component
MNAKGCQCVSISKKALLYAVLPVLAAILVLPAAMPQRAQAAVGNIMLVSANASGTEANNQNTMPSISADGRYVAFRSNATNLVAPATSNFQIFRKDLQTGEVKLVSCKADSTQGNNASSYPSMSADGRYVAFASYATNLLSVATSSQQVFRKDLQTGEVKLVSCTAAGTQGSAESGAPSMSPDGEYVAFASKAPNLVLPWNGFTNVYRKNVQTGELALCSTDSSGVAGNGGSYSPCMTADSAYVFFESDAKNLVSPPTTTRHIYRKYVVTGETILVSCTSSGAPGNNSSFNPTASPDGRYVVFDSIATDLVSPASSLRQAFRKDLRTGEVRLVSCSTAGGQGDANSYVPVISENGRVVSFASDATNLVSPATGNRQVFRKDMENGAVVVCSADAAGNPGNGLSNWSSITPDGRYVAFDTTATNLVSPPTSHAGIYRKELTVPTTFYFAEGYTGAGFQEYLCLGQLQNAPLAVTVTYLFKDGTSKVETYDVPAYSRFTANVNAVVGPDKDVSIRCDADYPFIAERPMYFDYGGGGGSWTGGHDAVGTPETSRIWYFAEGYTGQGFDEWVCVLNPGDAAADLTFRFQTQEEGEKVVTGYGVAPHSRASFKANQLLGGGSYQTSLALDSSQPVVAERPMYFNYQGTAGWNWTGGHCVMGSMELAQYYFFAEGTTRGGFEEWITLQNPSAAPITVKAIYLLGEGEPIDKEIVVDPARRSTIYVPNDVGTGKDVSVILKCQTPFLAERPMYFNYQGTNSWGWTGGHCVIGATSPAQDWFFAEGYTGGGFEEWLCIQNPYGTAANVTITYYPEGGGAPIVKPQPPIPGDSRYTVPVNSDAGQNLSICAEVSSDQGVICERPMYFNFQGKWTGGHDVVGYTP